LQDDWTPEVEAACPSTYTVQVEVQEDETKSGGGTAAAVPPNILDSIFGPTTV